MLGLVFMGMVRSFPPYHTAGVSLGNASPNIGRPLRDCSREASSWMTSQCSTMTPPSIRRMSAAIQLTGSSESRESPVDDDDIPLGYDHPRLVFQRRREALD